VPPSHTVDAKTGGQGRAAQEPPASENEVRCTGPRALRATVATEILASRGCPEATRSLQHRGVIPQAVWRWPPVPL